MKQQKEDSNLGLCLQYPFTDVIAQELLTRDNNPLKYILTYKFSQDHLELLFSKIRLRGGHNNNPTVVQLKAALKSILLRNSIKPARTGNCTNFDDALRQPNGFLNFSLKLEEEQQNDEVCLKMTSAASKC